MSCLIEFGGEVVEERLGNSKLLYEIRWLHKRKR